MYAHDFYIRLSLLYKKNLGIWTKSIFFSQGVHEPTDAECDFPSDSEDDEAELSLDVKDKVNFIVQEYGNILMILGWWRELLLIRD